MGFLPNTKISKKIRILPIIGVISLLAVILVGAVIDRKINEKQQTVAAAAEVISSLSEVSYGVHSATAGISEAQGERATKEQKIEAAEAAVASALQKSENIAASLSGEALMSKSHQSVQTLAQSMRALETALNGAGSGDFDNYTEALSKTESDFDSASKSVASDITTVSESASRLGTIKLLAQIVLFLIACVVLFAFSGMITSGITGKLSILEEAAAKTADGSFSKTSEISDDDEIGEVISIYNQIIERLTSVEKELSEFRKNVKNGTAVQATDPKKHTGSYKNISSSLYDTSEYFTAELKSIQDCVKELAKGSVSIQIPKLGSGQAEIEKGLNAIKQNLQALANEAGKMEKNAKNGDFSGSTELRGTEEGWGRLVTGFSSAVNAADIQFADFASSVEKISKGELRTKVSGSQKGGAEKLKNSINSLTEILGSYGDEFQQLPHRITPDRPEVKITKEFAGDYAVIKNSFNDVAERLNSYIKSGKEQNQKLKEAQSKATSSNLTSSTAYTAQIKQPQAPTPPAKPTAQRQPPAGTSSSKPQSRALTPKTSQEAYSPPPQRSRAHGANSVLSLAGQSRQQVNYDSSDAIIFENKDFGKY